MVMMMVDKSRIGDLVRQLRTSREITQEELARLSEVPFATINRLEKGTANPTLATLSKILKVFGYEVFAQRARPENSEKREVN